MKIKTSELQGTALNWAVAQCEGRENDGTWDENFSSNWLLGGPIIEQRRIGFEPWGYPGQWVAQIYNEAGLVLFREYGATPLIAAMRCYVASRLGDEIEVPSELIGE